MRAEEKRSSAGLLAGVHKAAADLLKQAGALLRESTGSFGLLSPRLLAFVSAGQALHVARCRLHQGLQLRSQAGEAAKTVREFACSALKKVMCEDGWCPDRWP